MFALNQDKLIMEMDKETFSLLISIIDMKPTVNTEPQADGLENDADIFSKINERCKDLCNKLIQSNGKTTSTTAATNTTTTTPETTNECSQIFFSSDTLNKLCNEYISKKRSPNSKKSQNLDFPRQDLNDFNAKLLALECLLSMNLNKQHHDSVDWFKSQLRDCGVFDKILEILKSSLTLVKQIKQQNNRKQENRSHNEEICLFFIQKYNRYLNFLECIVQSAPSASSTVLNGNRHDSTSDNKKQKKAHLIHNTSVTGLNQTYIVNFKNNFLIELVKE